MSITGVTSYPNLKAVAFINNFCKAFYLGCVKVKDDMIEQFYPGEDQHPLYCYETLKQVQQPKKGSKYTYKGTKKVRDKDMGMDELVEGEFPVKKFLTISSDIKFTLDFLLSTYMHDCIAYYKHKKHVLPADLEQLENELSEFCVQNNAYPIAHFVFASVKKYFCDATIPGPYNGLDGEIFNKSSIYFKNASDHVPKMQLTHLIDQFVKFIGVIQADLISGMFFYPTRKTVNVNTLTGILNTMNVKLDQNKLSAEYVKTLAEYVNSNKEATSKKKGDEKKKPPVKKPAAGGKRGRPKGKVTKKSDDESEEEMSDLEKNLDELDDARNSYEDFDEDNLSDD